MELFWRRIAFNGYRHGSTMWRNKHETMDIVWNGNYDDDDRKLLLCSYLKQLGRLRYGSVTLIGGVDLDGIGNGEPYAIGIYEVVVEHFEDLSRVF